jgi:hypothetical protein
MISKLARPTADGRRAAWPRSFALDGAINRIAFEIYVVKGRILKQAESRGLLSLAPDRGLTRQPES